MEYTVLARRFRPQAFGEVVGQEAISQALQNAIAADRVAHAYLFTGARGVGKTSTARILAKTLNCPSTQNGNPCNQCEVCESVSEGGDVDVIEIDGASNRGIDEIRTLRANVNIRPMRCRYKIYIIDEVHMLTKEAFNALLKTLEEPPPNVKFIFCTTDPQKLPDTILSRCQRFDFGTIETQRIRQRLLEIAQAEGVEVEPIAIDLVARRANGSMRDSQSLFDQLLAFGGPKVGEGDVHRLLGTAPDSRLISLIRAMATRNRVAVLQELDLALTQGVQLAELTDQLIGCCRDVMVLAAGAKGATLLAVGEDSRAELDKLGQEWGLQSILAAIQALADAKQRMKYVAYSRILLEVALVRIASLANLELLADAIAQLKSGKVPSGPLVVAGGTPLLTNATASPVLADGGSSASPTTAATPSDNEKKNDIAAANWRGQARDESNESTPTLSQQGTIESNADRSTEIAPETPIASVGVRSSDESQHEYSHEHVVSPDETAANSDHVGGANHGEKVAIDTGNPAEFWRQCITEIPDSPNKKAWIAARPANSAPNGLVLFLPAHYSPFKQLLDRSPEPVRELERLAERLAGQPVRIRVELDPPVATTATSQAKPTNREPDRRTSAPNADPYIQRALAAFSATVLRVDRIEPVSRPAPDSPTEE